MNCRTFEMQVADWLSGRLPDSIADRMAAHKATCPACAGIADAEARMRRQWSDLRTPAASADLWLKVESRIAQPSFKPSRLVFNKAYRWAAAACVLAIIVPVVMSANSVTKVPQTPIAPPVVNVVPASARQNNPTTDFASFIGDGQSNLSVDDPIGGTMEHVWTHVSTGDDTDSH